MPPSLAEDEAAAAAAAIDDDNSCPSSCSSLDELSLLDDEEAPLTADQPLSSSQLPTSSASCGFSALLLGGGAARRLRRGSSVPDRPSVLFRRREVADALRSGADLVNLVVTAVKDAAAAAAHPPCRASVGDSGILSSKRKSPGDFGTAASVESSSARLRGRPRAAGRRQAGGGRQLAAFVAADPDAIAAVLMLEKGLCRRLGLRLHVIVIACPSELGNACRTDFARQELRSVSCIFFINVGARHYVCKALAQLWQTDEEEGWRPRVFVVDHRRPYHPAYFRTLEDSSQSPRPQSPWRECNKFPTYLVTTSTEAEATAFLHAKLQRKTRGAEDEDEDEAVAAEVAAAGVSEVDLIALDDVAEAGGISGEFNGECATVVIFEALQQLQTETPETHLLAAVGAAFHFMMRYTNFAAYKRRLQTLAKAFDQMETLRKRQMHTGPISYSRSELLLPLFRFGQLKNSIQNAVPFVSRRLSWTATDDLLEKELAHARVSLGVKQRDWEDHFRLMLPTEQERVTQKGIPKYFRRLATGSLSEPTEVCSVDFFRKLRVVGLPDRMSSCDISFILMLLLSRPPRQASGDSQSDAAATNAVGLLSDFKAPAQFLGYGHPEFEAVVSDSLRLLDLLGNPRVMSGGYLSGPSLAAASSSSASKERVSYGNAWDEFLSFPSRGTNVIPDASAYRSLSSLATLSLALQSSIAAVATLILAKRSRGNPVNFRKSADGFECVVEMEVPRPIFSPDILRYLCTIAVEATERRSTAKTQTPLKGFVLVAACVTPGLPALVVAYKSEATAFATNRMGSVIHEAMRSLKTAGVFEAYAADYFDSSVASIPKAKIPWLLDSLFPMPTAGRQQKRAARRNARRSGSDDSSSDDEAVDAGGGGTEAGDTGAGDTGAKDTETADVEAPDAAPDPVSAPAVVERAAERPRNGLSGNKGPTVEERELRITRKLKRTDSEYLDLPRARGRRLAPPSPSEPNPGDPSSALRVKRTHQRIYYGGKRTAITENGWPETRSGSSSGEDSDQLALPPELPLPSREQQQQQQPASSSGVTKGWAEDYFQTSLSKKRRTTPEEEEGT